MNVIRNVGLASVLAVALMATGGCTKKDETGSAPATASADKKLVGFANATWGDPWRVALNQQTEEAAKTNPNMLLQIVDGKDDNVTQIEQIKGFVTKKVSVLIVSPNTEAVTPAVEEAFGKGIPVVVVDRKTSGDKYTTYISGGSERIGEEAGKFVVETLKGKGNVIEIKGTEGASATVERNKGFMTAIAKATGIKVVVSQPADYKRSKAQEIVKDLLTSHKDVQCIYAHNDEMIIGAHNAAQSLGREKNIIFVGIDGQQSAIDMIAEGKIHATFVYTRPGEKAIEVAAKILKKEPVEKFYELPTTKVTKENAKDVKGF